MTFRNPYLTDSIPIGATNFAASNALFFEPSTWSAYGPRGVITQAFHVLVRRLDYPELLKSRTQAVDLR